MIDLRVHVGIETIFARIGDIPGGGRLLRDQLILTIDLMLLKPYFQGSNDAHRRAILRRQGFSIHTDGDKRQRMHSFVQPQALHVRR